MADQPSIIAGRGCDGQPLPGGEWGRGMTLEYVYQAIELYIEKHGKAPDRMVLHPAALEEVVADALQRVPTFPLDSPSTNPTIAGIPITTSPYNPHNYIYME